MESSSNLLRYGAVVFSGVALSVIWLVGAVVLVPTDGRTSLLMAVSAFVALAGAMMGVLWLVREMRVDEIALADLQRGVDRDTLTGLPNQNSLAPLLEERMASAKRSNSILGVLSIDVAQFKTINDSMGHLAAEELISQVAERITSAVRISDDVVRVNADEFVVLCSDLLTERSVVDVAQQVLGSVEGTLQVQSTSQKISGHIGIAILSENDNRSATELLRDAGLAMTAAKHEIMHLAVFNEEHRLAAIERQQLEQDLIRAVEQKEFFVVYQPLVDLTQGRLYGFEALVRWNHPTRGELTPGAFVSAADKLGLIGEISHFVMREACAQAAIWNHQNPKAQRLAMGVNLAEQQLLDASLPKVVAETLRWAGIEASQLVLEISENVMVEHLASLDSLRELCKLGVSLAVDDFGTGQSSLSYLKQFDMVSTLKIDQSFVRGLEASNADRAIVQAVVDMSEALGLSIVVEGVETEAQRKILSDMGVCVMQGFLFSRPIKPLDGDPLSWFKPAQPVEGKASRLPPPTHSSEIYSQPDVRLLKS